MEARDVTRLVGLADRTRARAKALARYIQFGNTTATRRFAALAVEDARAAAAEAERVWAQLAEEHGWPEN